MNEEDIPWLKSKFSEVDWQGLISFNEYLEDINSARKIGYAIDRDKYYLGISTVSVAFDQVKTGRRYCLTAVLLSGAHDVESINRVGSDLKSAASKLASFS